MKLKSWRKQAHLEDSRVKGPQPSNPSLRRMLWNIVHWRQLWYTKYHIWTKVYVVEICQLVLDGHNFSEFFFECFGFSTFLLEQLWYFYHRNSGIQNLNCKKSGPAKSHIWVVCLLSPHWLAGGLQGNLNCHLVARTWSCWNGWGHRSALPSFADSQEY